SRIARAALFRVEGTDMPRTLGGFDPGRVGGTGTTDTSTTTSGPTGTTQTGGVTGTTGTSDKFGVGATAQATSAQPMTPDQIAVKKFRDLVKTGKLESLYQDAIGTDPTKKKEALDLFQSLPKINGDTSVADLVKLGVITKAPAGLDAALKSARY